MTDRAEWLPASTPEHASALESPGIPAWMAELLARRGVADAAEAARFLNPSLDHLHDPFLLAGLDEAADRLVLARDAGEAVAIVGDYDVDGVSATALLLAVLRACGLTAHEILPHRLKEGYGFQPVHVEKAVELGCSVIVTVDCGVSSTDAIDAASEREVDVIITDHHLPGEELPPSAVLVNPRQEGCEYPFPDLAGVGLAFKLALGVAERCGRQVPIEALLRIACLGTIADLVPLTGENRVIAALGLAELGRTPSPGLQALFKVAGIKPPFDASDVGFRIGPRLNAAGRLDDAASALELLLARDRRRAQQLAEELDRWNRSRQAEERRVFEEALERLRQRDPLPAIAVAWDATWHKGVLGIAAGRIARELHRPTLLLAEEEDRAVGSGRSVPGIEIHRFLSAWQERLTRFGGHAQAVGMTVPLAALADLRAEWEAKAEEDWPEDLLRPRHRYELELPTEAVDGSFLARLEALEPFGQSNSRPLLRVGPMELVGAPRIFGKENDHLSAVARGEDGGRLELIGWRWRDRKGELETAFEALGYLERDRYRNGPVLRLIDVRPAAFHG
ncbi:MAG: single-stranded-DNA-specific exonuclease RecJ [Acidobacteriota bacterium]